MSLQPPATPTANSIPFRAADFATLTEALDYAAQGDTGANFYTGRGAIYESLPYKQLREQCRELAAKLLGFGLTKGDRVAIIAETSPEFVRFFYACEYAGLVPVALPASVKVGAHSVYVKQLRLLLEASDASVAVSSEGYLNFLREAGEPLAVRMIDTPEAFHNLPAASAPLPQINPEDIAYIQYTSGSTRFPRGVVIKHHTAMANLQGISGDGLKMTAEDRLMSWLPFYHDMGLVGLCGRRRPRRVAAPSDRSARHAGPDLGGGSGGSGGWTNVVASDGPFFVCVLRCGLLQRCVPAASDSPRRLGGRPRWLLPRRS